MPSYRNDNTGQVVDFDEPNPRLEVLDNWRRVDDVPLPDEPVVEVPKGNASLADWQAYAHALGIDQAVIEGRTRDQLRDDLAGAGDCS